MIKLNQVAAKLALLVLVLMTGCTEAKQPQPTISPLSSPSAQPTQVGEAAPSEAALPTADEQGDYSTKTSHKQWRVVDPDPDGVNCRWSEEMPKTWYAPDAKLPTLSVNQWPIVRRFKKNTASQYLTANLTPAGFATLFDESGKPWLKVSVGSADQICLVRANSKYVQPVNLEGVGSRQ